MSPYGDNKLEMKKIGTGFRMVGDKLLVKLSVVPDININVYSESGEEVGKLVDVIGPVKSPFGVVMSKCDYDLQGKILTAK